MELKDVVFKRKTVRDFKPTPISPSIIEYAIGNAFRAPTYNHLREWDFILVESSETKKLITEAERIEGRIDTLKLEREFENEEAVMREMYMSAIPKQKRMIIDAPVVVLVVYKPKTAVEKAIRIYDLNCLASVWTCIENFLLSLAEHNIFGVTYIPKDTSGVKKLLNIPLELEIAAVIPIGYKADDSNVLAQKSLRIEERIHLEKW